MSKTPKFDQKIQKILDAAKPGEQTCILTGKKWQMTQEEITWYKRFSVPPLKIYPDAYLKYLCGFASGVALWWKPHAKTGKPTLSFVHPDNPIQIVSDKEWFADDYLDSFDFDPVTLLSVSGVKSPNDYEIIFGDVGIGTSKDTAIGFIKFPANQSRYGSAAIFT